MEKKCLIIYIPVIHKGYVDFLNSLNGGISDVYIIDNNFLAELSDFKPDIAAIDTEMAKNLLEKMGFENISILSKENIKELDCKEIILVRDEISEGLCKKYLKEEEIEWKSVFLRWDKKTVLVQQNLADIQVSSDELDIKMMKEAYNQSEKSGDWWRQIGAVLVKDGKILFNTYNKDLPSDHTPYQVGEVRDLFNPGERPDMASTIHAEQGVVAKAAKEGISINGTSLYVTTFPCPVCAKLIACSGIKNLYFGEGWSNFDAKKVLESANVKIINVPII
jgi:dCMP deaminase